jgi:hypothetical protein
LTHLDERTIRDIVGDDLGEDEASGKKGKAPDQKAGRRKTTNNLKQQKKKA